jgi:thiamine-monophosphate kinase
MKKGDLLAYTGDLGRSAKDLRKLFHNGRVNKNSKFIAPSLRWDFIQKTRKYLRCGMDISDGLFSDLEKLSHINDLGFSFIKKISKSVACSGEEYELLFSFDKRYKTAIIRQAKRTRTKINIFATAQRKHFRNTCKRHHF